MNEELLHILACPKCHGSLELVVENAVATGLRCPACALMYPIRDAIPIMLVEEAVPLTTSSQTAE